MKLPGRFLKFLMVGGLSTCIDFGVFSVFYSLLGWHVAVANVLGYSVGLTNSFFINRKFTFIDGTKKSRRRLWVSLLWGYIGLVLNTGIVWGLSFYMDAYMAKVIAVIFIIIFNYNTNKHFVFAVR